MNTSKYEHYKDSKIGTTPEHWTVLPLKRIASLKSGETITTDSITQANDFPVFGGNGLRGFTDSFTHDGTFPLIGRQGALCGNINFASGKFWASEHAIVVSPIRPLDMHWLGELLRSMNLNQHSVSAAQPGLSVDVLNDLLLPLPPLPEQQAIAAFLDRETAEIDALIAAKERMLSLMAEKRKALITEAVTRGLDPEVERKDSGVPWIGDIPAHWKVTRLKFVAEVQGGVALGKDYGNATLVEYPYLRVANVQDGYLNLNDVATITLTEREAALCTLQAGDVLMNEGGDADKLGRGCIWHGQIAPCLHQNHVFAIRPQKVSAEWINAWTNGDGAKSYFESRAKQSTNLASISTTSIKELFIALPRVEEHQQILAFIETETAKLDALKAATERTIGLLKERRSALIAAAVTGQIRVQ